MEQLNQIAGIVALSMGTAWASGINLYAAILMLGLLGNTGNISLPPDLVILADPMVMLAAGFMYCVEFFADKIPGVDNGWDALHTFIRIPAGAVLAAGAVGDVGAAASLAAGLVGGGLAASSHAAKAGSRVLVNTSPEPFSNWLASLGEDVMVILGLWTALHYPVLFLVFLALFLLALVWLMPKLWRGVRMIAKRILRLFSAMRDQDPESAPPPNRALLTQRPKQD